jgi:hypothetical protein
MFPRNIGQSTRFILGAVSACALVACTQDAFLMRVPATPTKDACEEAAEYGRRAAAADDDRVKAGLQRIADSKSRECAAKTGVSDAPSVPAS